MRATLAVRVACICLVTPLSIQAQTAVPPECGNLADPTATLEGLSGYFFDAEAEPVRAALRISQLSPGDTKTLVTDATLCQSVMNLVVNRLSGQTTWSSCGIAEPTGRSSSA